ncbi:MAG TPA: hypothetical protein VI215_13250 [Bacteroidota bacterium]|jgi:hypothetical protein
MQSFVRRTGSLGWLLTLLLALEPAAAAGFPRDGELRATNVRFVPAGDRILIHYDLSAPADAEVEVSVSLRKESDSSFSYSPKNLSGDFGPGRYSGVNRTIEWGFAKEFPAGLAGNDYYFAVSVREVASGGFGMSPLIGAGAAVLGVGILTLLLANNHGDSPAAPAPASGFPAPPGRP